MLMCPMGCMCDVDDDMGRAGRAEIAMAGYTVNSVSCGANCAARDAVTGVMCEKGAVSKRQCALPSLLRHSMNSMFLLFFGFLSHFPCFVRDAPIGPVRRGDRDLPDSPDSARH